MILYALRSDVGVLDHSLSLRAGGVDAGRGGLQDVAWAINSPEGSIRSASTGEFLSVRANCLDPLLSFDRFTDWKITRSDLMGESWVIQAGCGGILSTENGKLVTVQSDSRVVPQSWDIVPIGTTVEPKDVAMQHM